MTKPEKRYDVFINYNSRDKLAVDVLAARLERQGIQCFRDVWDMVPGRGVVPQLLNGIEVSHVVVAFIGRHALGPWQAREVLSALEERVKGKHVLPVFFPAFPSKEREKLAAFLQSPTQVLFSHHLDEVLPFEQLLKAIQGELRKQEPQRLFPEEGGGAPRRELQNPYKGLSKFLERDSAYFFGRKRVTDDIIADIEGALSTREGVRLFVLTGASGSGKSSLARAGLMASLKKRWGEAWRYATVGNPGREPLYELALQLSDEATFEEALLRDLRTLDRHIARQMSDAEGGKFVLLIDQFEEVFTLCQEAKQRRAFIDNLLFAATKDDGKCIVLLTLRNEFLQHFVDRVSDEACNGKAYLCRKSMAPATAMSQPELREAILAPAQMMGVGYELALLDSLLEDASTLQEEADTREGILPLLQVALEELWQFRSPNHIGYGAYRETGGIRGALEKRANDIYNSFDEVERRFAQHIFLNLLRINPEGPETRQRVKAEEFVHGQKEAAKVIEKLVDGRLLVSDKGELEIIHEALLWRWGVLRDWTERNREGKKRKQGIEDAAALWQSGAGELLTGSRLAAALAWDEEDAASFVPLGLNAKAREFLKASQKREEEERQKDNTQLRRRLIAYAGFAAFMCMLVLLMASLLEDSNRKSTLLEEQRAVAEQRRAVADARRLASASLLEQNKRADLSLLLAMASIGEMEATQNPALAESESALLTTLLWHPPLAFYLHGHTGPVKSFAFSPDGSLLASAGNDKTILLWSVEERRALATLRGHGELVQHVTFSPDGKLLASASYDKTIVLWEVEKQQVLTTLRGHGEPANHLSFSPDGRLLASASYDKTIVLWEVEKQQALATLRGHGGPVNHLAFSPDGRLLASASHDKTIVLWEVDEQKALKTLRGHEDGVYHLAFSPDGRLLASASRDKTVILWELEQKQHLKTLRNHDNYVVHLLFSPDGKVLASASVDKTIVLWNVQEQRVLETLRGHSNTILRLSFHPEGKLLASASADGTLMLWELGHQQALATLHGHGARIRCLSFSPDGRLLASAGDDGTVIVWNLAQQPALATLREHEGEVSHLSVSPDGRVLASASVDKTIILWDVEKKQSLARLRGHEGLVHRLAFSPDGRVLASADAGGTLFLWNVEEQRALAPLHGHENWVLHLTFSPDGKVLASSGVDQTIILWEVEKQQALTTLRGHEGWVYHLAFSPDGRLLASASADKTIVLWEMEQRQALATLREHQHEVIHLSFSPDGSLLASASNDGTVILWSVKERKHLATLRGHEDWVRYLSFSPDGSLLASAGSVGTLILWDVKQRQALARWYAHDNHVIHLAFSPDGSLLASASDSTLVLWDVKQRQALARWRGHGGDVNYLAFSPDGRVLFSASADKTIQLWDVSRDSWRERARKIVNRNMTFEEWRTHMGERTYRKTFEDLPGPSALP